MKNFPLTGLVPVVISIIIFPGCGGESSSEEETQELTRDITIEPVWEGADTVSVEDSVSEVFHLLWDQSIPMGGYVHKTDPDSQFILQRIQELLLSARLISNYGGNETALECLGVKEELVPIACDRRLSRDFFDGRESRIDQAIKHLTQNNMRGAALITDFMTTTEYGIGATALLPYFRDTKLRASFNQANIHLAILGIRIPYWGVQEGGCLASEGALGCWFDEGQQRYRILEGVANRPIYVLIIGRSVEGDRRKNNSVTMIAEELSRSLVDLGFDVKSDAITAAPTKNTSNITWKPDLKEDAFKSVRLSKAGFYCKERGTHPVKGELRDSSFLFSVGKISLSPKDTLVAEDDINKSDGEEQREGLRLDLDCGKIRDTCKDKSTLSALITVELDSDGMSHETDWSAWSSIEHDAHSTLYLSQFIEGLRPSHYITEIPLPLSCP